jgi:serine/threonine-protein kinase
MEWLEGKTLAGILRGGPLTTDEALPIVEQLCQALAAAHQAGVIHRDLKGSNVMLIKDAAAFKVKLVDFGIAKQIASEAAKESQLTTTGQALGTPHTMAPEQITGRPLDERVDVYALGVILFEMLTGRPPFDAPSSIEIADMHLRTKPPHAYDLAPVTESVDAVIQRCLAKKPTDRYDSPTDVAKALRIAAQRRPLTAPAANDAQHVFALGLYFQAHLQGDEDEVPDHVFDDMEDLLATAHERCTQAGLQMAMSSGQAFLAVLPLAPQGTAGEESRRKLIDLALDLTELFKNNGDHLSVQVALHGAPVKTVGTAGATQFVGGELLAIGDWAGQKITAPVYATKPVLSGLEHRFKAEPVTGRGDHLRILGRA